MRKRWASWLLLLVVAIALGSLVAAYGGQLLPGGIVTGTSHPLSTVVKDDARTSVDRNVNGIIDEAEACPTCVGGGAIDIRHVADDTQGVPSSKGEPLPLQLAPDATVSVVTLRQGWIETIWCGPNGPTGPGSKQYVARDIIFTDIKIDWRARTIQGVQYGSRPTLAVGFWDVSAAQSDVKYYADACTSPGCPALMVDFEDKVIETLPKASGGYGDSFAGTVETYS